MKIACITPDDLSTLLYCKTMSRLLAQRGDAEFITIGGVVEGQSVETYRAEVRAQVRSKHYEVAMRRFVSPIQDIFYAARLYRILRRESCSAVVTWTTKPNIYGQFAAKLAGIPIRVMAVRGLGRTFGAPSGLREYLLRGLMKALYRVAGSAATMIWFTNQGDLTEFTELGICRQETIFLTKNAVDLSDFCAERVEVGKLRVLRKELGLAESGHAVIMVARLIEQKGVREYAQAAESLRARFPAHLFLLVAPEEPGHSASVPLAYIRVMEKRSNLRWLGFRKDVRELYALCDLAVLPSYYKEGGYPRALLEAMAYAKPVIGADTPECRGPVDDGSNGYLVPPRDAVALARAIEKVLENPARARDMGARSLEKMRREFDDATVFTALIDRVCQAAK